MAPVLYSLAASPPVRAVWMTAKAIGLDLDIKELNLLKNEHLTPEYLKINPQHTIPTLVDENGFILWDSHAICTYLIEKYAKTDELYPKDLQKRALIDQRLHFESGIVFPRLVRMARPIIFMGKKSIDTTDKEVAIEAYQFLNEFLEGNDWVCGNSVTVADYSLIASISSMNTLTPIDARKYPNVAKWLKRAEQLPAYEENKEGLEGFKALTFL